MKRLPMLLVAAAMVAPLPAQAEKLDLSTITCKKFFEYNKENIDPPADMDGGLL